NRLRVAIDHHRLIAVVTQRKSGVAAAVIELNSLPDAIRSAAQDDHLLFLGRGGLVLFLVSRVEIGCEALEFGGAGVHSLVDWLNFVLLAEVTNLLSRAFTVVKPPCSRQPPIGKTHALGIAQHLARD